MLQYCRGKGTSGYDTVTSGVVELAAYKLKLLEKLKAVTPETNKNSAKIKCLGQWKQTKWVNYLWVMYDSQVCIHFCISSRMMLQT